MPSVREAPLADPRGLSLLFLSKSVQSTARTVGFSYSEEVTGLSPVTVPSLSVRDRPVFASYEASEEPTRRYPLPRSSCNLGRLQAFLVPSADIEERPCLVEVLISHFFFLFVDSPRASPFSARPSKFPFHHLLFPCLLKPAPIFFIHRALIMECKTSSSLTPRAISSPRIYSPKLVLVPTEGGQLKASRIETLSGLFLSSLSRTARLAFRLFCGCTFIADCCCQAECLSRCIVRALVF